MPRPKMAVGLLCVAGLLAPSAQHAATCSAQARYVKAQAQDAKGFKQGITLAVSASAVSHGLVSYTVSYKDKTGATQTKTANVQYKFAGGTGGSGGGGTRVTEETVLGAAMCTDKSPCTITSVAVGEISCFKDGGGKCSASGTYVDSAPRDAKGFKQAINFNLSSADCGAACHGLLKYTATYKDKDGATQTKAGNYSYKMSSGGGGNEIEVVDETVLGAGQCTDASPCKVTGATVDKVSCFVER